MCGACEEECPVFIEYIDKMVDLRRYMVESGREEGMNVE
jgi:L-lactate utilization protein LutB